MSVVVQHAAAVLEVLKPRYPLGCDAHSLACLSELSKSQLTRALKILGCRVQKQRINGRLIYSAHPDTPDLLLGGPR